MFTIVQCAGCGLDFVNPRLTEEEIKGLYDRAYFEGQGFDPFILLEEVTQKVAGARRALDRIVAVKSPPADVLEVGPAGRRPAAVEEPPWWRFRLLGGARRGRIG